MPVPALKGFAKRANVSLETAETKWDEAKREVDNKLRTSDPKQYWAKVMFVTKKKLGLNEELTFKEYAEVNLAVASDPVATQDYTMAASSYVPEPAPAPEEEKVQADPMMLLAGQLSTFVSCLFGARDIAHMFHLNTTSFAQHKALEELYELLVDHADKWAEVGIGITGFPLGFCIADASRYPSGDPLSFIRNLAIDLMDCHGPCFASNPVLSNMMQELQAEVYRVKYKLEQLH
jgi:hypothetical protein